MTDDERLVWLSAWLFCVANWVGQDFFAPQGLSYFLYLVILAILLRWFTVAPAGSAAGAGWANAQLASGTWPPWTTEPDPELPPAKRGALLAIAIVCFGALVSMHQLTAVAVLACVTALVALRRSRARWLPVLMAGVIGAWITFPAATYSVGLPGELIGLTDSIAGSVEQSIGGAAEGSDDHRAIVQLRLVLTLGLGALAALGAVRAFRGGRRDLTVGVLAVAPLPFLLLQPEGGELVLRLYVFSLPFVAFFAASAFYPGRAVVFTKRDLVRSWRTTRVLLLASVAFAVGFFFVRYGNERADSFTADEVRAVEALYAAAPPGSVLVAANGNLPWRFEHLAEYDYKQVVRAAAWTSLASSRSSMRAVVAEVVRLMRREGHGRAYLIITRSQKAAADLLGSGPRGSLSRFETAVAGSSAFSLVYENRDAAIYVLGGGGRGPAT